MQTRTPYHELPIVLAMKAVGQKYFRELHCLECGFPIIGISDKVLMASDSTSTVVQNDAAFGPAEIHCKRHTCKQRYRLEFAL
jgi:hypothetical protein